MTAVSVLQHSDRVIAFIPATLEPRTQVALRHLMRKPRAKSDRAGYIYALKWIGKFSFSFYLCEPFYTTSPPDQSNPDLIRIKVGRSKNVARRLSEHRRRCPSSRPVLLGHTSLSPYCDRLERLVHVELADRAAQSYPAGRTAPRTRCPDCTRKVHLRFFRFLHCTASGSTHTEIFTFRRLRGRKAGREWSLIIRPILQRWTRLGAKRV